MTLTFEKKMDEILLKYTFGGLAIAFSGGTDSACLLKAANNILNGKVIAVTVVSSLFSKREVESAINFCKEHNIKHQIIEFDELSVAGFTSNPPNRCYICKKELFTQISKTANENGFENIADGTNADDQNDYNPGLKALEELNIISPLRDAGLSKIDIREYAKQLKISSYDKPSISCLATRFPYGETISKEKLCMVGEAEKYLSSEGIRQCRVRIHNGLARIEVSTQERHMFFNDHFMDKVNDRFKEIGFIYTTLDLKGYTIGSMDEELFLNRLC